jgi:hypothetical protein
VRASSHCSCVHLHKSNPELEISADRCGAAAVRPTCCTRSDLSCCPVKGGPPWRQGRSQLFHNLPEVHRGPSPLDIIADQRPCSFCGSCDCASMVLLVHCISDTPACAMVAIVCKISCSCRDDHAHAALNVLLVQRWPCSCSDGVRGAGGGKRTSAERWMSCIGHKSPSAAALSFRAQRSDARAAPAA